MIPDEDAQLDDEELEQLQDAMEMDYEIGSVGKDKIIRRRGFVAHARCNEDSDDEDYDEDDDDDDDDESDDEFIRTAATTERGAGPAEGADGEKPPECKQQ